MKLVYLYALFVGKIYIAVFKDTKCPLKFVMSINCQVPNITSMLPMFFVTPFIFCSVIVMYYSNNLKRVTIVKVNYVAMALFVTHSLLVN